MALHLNVSNSLKELSLHLCNDLQQQQHDPFQPVFIITQTDGMTTWLKYQVAGHLEIAANYRYLKSQDIINQVYFMLGGKSVEILSPQNFSWILFKLLGDEIFIEKFAAVSGYYNIKTSEGAIKRMSIAGRTADLFDQYQIYRPEMISDWNKTLETGPEDDWQDWLWKKAKILLSDKLPDKTNISKYIIEELKKPAQQQYLQQRMPAIYLFGLSITTNYHLEIYHAIGQFVEVKFHLINPAPEQYWFEDINDKQLAVLRRKGFTNIPDQPLGNPLLTSWGKVLQDTYGILFQDEELLNTYNDVGIAEPSADSLLKKIQADIFFNNHEITSLDKDDCLDGSLTINSCYSPAREVEVLYNWLVQLADAAKEKLSPRDIVVMVSDINTYTPYIKAIFDNGPYTFRYSIADESFTTGDTVSAAIKSLLSISEESFTSENVVQLLDSSFIRKRFSLTDISLVREVINKANIRFGTENSLEDDTRYVSWNYGLKRIMYGICMSGEEEYGSGVESFYPIDVVEGNAATQLIRFTHFVETLIEAMEERATDRTINEWVEYVQNLLDNMVCEPDLHTDEDYLLLIKQLGAYNVLNEFFTEKVSYRVFSHSFLKTLESGTSTGSFVSSGITFCSLIPMRSIPFKVVAMLGLNFDKFPRKDTTVSFNKMEQQKRKGDRNVKDNDKHLFLETLLSAQEYLYISYVGQNAKDNSNIPPSALVDELIDYIQTSAKDVSNVRNMLLKKHPLHGFSRLYNQPGTGLITYLNSGKEGIDGVVDPGKQMEPLSFDEISLDAFISFFKNPFKGYYNNVLKIYYNEDEVLLDEQEVFELDNLQQWQLKNELLVLNEEDSFALKDRLVKTGRLPLKHTADVAIENVNADVAGARELFRDCVGGAGATSTAVEIEIGEATIRGNLKNIYGDKMVAVSFSSNESKYLLEAYIRYLAARATGMETTLYYISAKRNEIYAATPITTSAAISALKGLIQLYKEGHERILAFYPSFKINPDALDGMEAAAFQKAINDELNNYMFPGTDHYILKEYGNGFYEEEGVMERYKSQCELLLKPLSLLFPEFYKN